MNKRVSPEQWIEEKKIKQLLQRIVVSLLEARPENVEQHIVQLLSAPPKQEEEAELWPSLRPNDLPQSRQALVVGSKKEVAMRRQSAISPNVLSKFGSLNRRKAMSSKMTSNTDVEIVTIPKDEATFAALEETVKKVDLFSFLQDDQRKTLVNAMFPLEYKDKDVIIKQGAQPDNFYILKEGNVYVTIKQGDQEKKVATLKPGQYFGELALISGSTRTATVIADGPVSCWAISQTTYLGLLKDQHTKKRERYKVLLRNVPFLKILQDYDILLVADALQPINPKKGEILIKQGDNGDEFYIILEGECTVLKRDEGSTEEKEVGKLRSGAYFGELALLHDAPRAASIQAGDNCKLVKLDRNSFHRLLGPLRDTFTENMKLYQSTK